MIKKILVTICALMCCVLMGFSQDCGTIYEIPENNGCRGWIRVIDEGFYLFSTTDNIGEFEMASIYLGKNVDSAIDTLRRLQKLDGQKEGEIILQGYEAKTQVIQFGLRDMSCLIFSTEGVMGDSYLLCDGFDYDMAIMAIGEYIPPDK